MPQISQMFPRRYMSFEDLEKDKVYVMTIKAVAPESAKAKPKGGGWGKNEPVDVEVLWLLWFHESRKPLVLKRNRAEKISMIFGDANTDNWIGRRIGIYRGIWANGGESGEGLMIDDRPLPALPSGPAGSSKTIIDPKVVIPRNAIDRFIQTVGEKGKSWEDFQRWLKVKDPDMLAAVWGTDLDRIPAAAVPFLKGYLDQLHAGAAPATAAGMDIVDTQTGEIIKPPPQAPQPRPPAAATAPAITAPAIDFSVPPAGAQRRRHPLAPPDDDNPDPQPPPDYQPIDPDDIPF